MSTRQPQLFDAVDAETDAAEQARIAEHSAEHSRLRFARQCIERAAKWAATPAEAILRMRIAESAGDTDPLTKTCLGLAVPMWIDRMRYWRADYRVQVGRMLVEILAYEQGAAALCDPEARGTAMKGDKAKAFNAVAQGLACLAFCPGGIVFAGWHWEATAYVQAEVEP